ncbi:hypothetical protein, partial [Paraburkholderia nemoris]|uniref:hypothetical protein n=1 Tax=Paraburkholderia nemoris TaxID=2793076 RepID=UPI001B8CFD1C
QTETDTQQHERATLVPGVMLENCHLYVSIELSFSARRRRRNEASISDSRIPAVSDHLGRQQCYRLRY